MAWWLTGDEEHDKKEFEQAGPHSLGLYVRAGSWCMDRVRYRPESEIPPEWFIPTTVVKGWGLQRVASGLVKAGLWDRVEDGYRYRWIRPENTADALRQVRKRERDKKRKSPHRPAATQSDSPGESANDSPGESAVIPQGTYRGES